MKATDGEKEAKTSDGAVIERFAPDFCLTDTHASRCRNGTRMRRHTRSALARLGCLPWMMLLASSCSGPAQDAGSVAPKANDAMGVGDSSSGRAKATAGEDSEPSGSPAATANDASARVTQAPQTDVPTTSPVSGGPAGASAQAGARSTGAAGATATNSAGSAGSAPARGQVVTFHNGGFWSDDNGQRIEAHGGGFLRFADTWYWFGEDKSGNSAGFKGVNCYASKDLVSWQSRGAVVTRATAPELDTMDRIIERPKVVYNASTHRFVMWLHWEGRNYAEAKAGVFSSDAVDGPYTFHSAFQPNGNMSRDDTLFVDDDGTAYFISAANENADLMVYELSADYLTVERQVIKLFAGQKREAPALFKANAVYYLITSGATGWEPNQAMYATATSLAGPWSELHKLGNASTFDSQPTYVIAVNGIRDSQTTTYIYAGDRWQDPDLASSKYIWLPLTLDDSGALSLDYYADWSIDLETGQWSADDGYIPQTDWRLLHVDSEETEAEDGRASHAFDGSASTIWHTAYTNDKPPPPHELQIDLGAAYAIEAMRYLPRQDNVDHGGVAAFEFYISDDPARWGMPAASGEFAADRAPKLVTFTPTVGRYVRFVALREINDRPYTSVAELDLAGTRQ